LALNIAQEAPLKKGLAGCKHTLERLTEKIIMTTKPNITFIGIGLMGTQISGNLVKAGYPVTVWNRNIEKCQAVADLGATVANSIADSVANADIVFTCLAGAAAIDAVYFGEDGVVPNAPKNSLIIDLSSLAPEIAKENHAKLTQAGYRHLDAPVTGGVSGAEAATLSILVGGSEADLDEARAVFETIGTPFYLGGEGAGQVCKLVNQTIVHVFIGAVSEGMMLAASAGIEASQVREALIGGYCQSKILDIHGEKMAHRDFIPGGPLEFSVKDLEGSSKIAEDANLKLPLTATVLEQYRELVADGKGRCDHSGLVLAYEKHNPHIRVAPNAQEKIPE
jgi:2-hydroxy-3-oxopropionate reductase